MAIVKTASQVPIPQVIDPSDILMLEDYDISSSVPSLPSARSILANETVWVNDFNRNAAYLDILSQSGSGMIAIISGLELIDGGGLTVDVSEGTALIGGLIQLPGGDSIVVADNTDNFIWLKQDNSLESVNGSTTPPAGAVCYLGCVTTLTGAITVIDFSGVVYNYSGVPFRETGDTGEPADTPPVNWIGVTKTTGVVYQWNGGSYSYSPTESEFSTAVGDIVAAVEMRPSNASLSADDAFKINTNEGAGSKPNYTLPAATGSGKPFIFYVQDAFNLRITAQSGDTIRIGTLVSASGGHADSFAVGDSVTLVDINNTEWVAISLIGTGWTVT